MLSLTTAPTVEPVTLDDARTHLRITHTEEDTYLEDFVIPTARRLAEALTHRAFLTQTWTLTLRSGFPSGVLVLPRPPLSSVTSVTYVDNDGTSQTWAASNYTVTAPSGELALHGTLEPAYNVTYPSTRDIASAVTIVYVAGYGAAASSVPVAIRHAVLMLCEDLYAQRSSQVSVPRAEAMYAAQALLAPFLARRDDLRYD